jgi:heme-degrading monooxygenase HmoA
VFARFTTLRGDPNKPDSAATMATVVDQVDGESRAAVEATPGNRGFAVLADPRHATIIGASYWDCATSMRASHGTLASLRDAAVSTLGGDGVGVERYEVAVAFRHTIPSRGSVVRLSRSRIDPTRIDEADVLMYEEVLPRVKGANGLCSFQLLRDRESGAGMIITTWENQAAAEAFAPVAEQLRARASDRIGLRFEPPETLEMVRTTAQL